MTKVLVTGAGEPLGANIARSLKDAPEPMHLIGADSNRWHLPLSICERTYQVPHASERAAYATALAEVIKTESIDVLLPSHPVEVRAAAELYRHLGAATALPRPSVLGIAENMLGTYERLRERGVPVPESLLLSAERDVDEAFARLAGRPLWICGAGVPGIGISGAALPCHQPGMARAWVEHHQGWGKMAASECLPGASLTWIGGFADGVLLAAGARERLESVLPHAAPSGITGASAVSRTIRRDEVAEHGERAVRAIDDRPHGVYSVEMKEDASGAPRVTSIHAGRCSVGVAAYTEAGYNFPWLLVRLARGDNVRPLPTPNQAIEPDVYWVRTLDCGPVTLRGSAAFGGFPRVGVDNA